MDRLTAVPHAGHAIPPAPTLRARGFTLTEMAMVLLIVALLIGGMIVPMSAQQDLRNRSDTEKTMVDVTESMVGFAAGKLRPYLPCPDTTGDGLEDRAGTACVAQEGNLPWATLGLARQDAWGNPFRYRVTAAFSDSGSGFSLLSTGDIRVCADNACATVLATNVPAIIVSRGKNGTAVPTDIHELENTDGDTDFVQRTAAGFDDLVAWLPSSILIHRMIAVGRLP